MISISGTCIGVRTFTSKKGKKIFSADIYSDGSIYRVLGNEESRAFQRSEEVHHLPVRLLRIESNIPVFFCEE